MGVEQSSTVVSVVAVLVGVVEVLVDVDVLVEVEVLVDVEEVLVEVDVVEVPVAPVVRLVPVVPVVLVVVGVVPRSAVLFGDAWACAGTTTDSTTGFIHRDRQSADRQNLKNPPPSELSHPITRRPRGPEQTRLLRRPNA
jgi:hypothetical protein